MEYKHSASPWNADPPTALTSSLSKHLQRFAEEIHQPVNADSSNFKQDVCNLGLPFKALGRPRVDRPGSEVRP